MTQKEYSASSIQNLTAAQHLKKRLSLTFGGERGSDDYPYSTQKQVAVSEIYSNAFDEVLGGHAENVRVSFYEDGSFEVQDSGRGIPVDSGTDAHGVKKSGVMMAIGTLQSGGKFNQESGEVSTGLNGVGASSVAVVSSRMDVTVYRSGKEHTLSFKQGDPGFFDGDGPDADFTPLEDMSYLKKRKDPRSAEEKRRFKTGTNVKVWLDESAFSSSYPYNTEDIIERLRSTAFLIPAMHLEVFSEQTPVVDPETSEKQPYHEYFHFDDGLTAFADLLQTRERLTPVHHIQSKGVYTEHNVAVLDEKGNSVNKNLQREIDIDVAFTYDTGYESNVKSFVNTIHTHHDGVHVTALQRAMSKAFNERISTMRGMVKKGRDTPTVDDYMEGLTAVVSVKMQEPQFTSQSKEGLTGKEVQKSIHDALLEEFRKWIKAGKNADDLKTIAEKVSTASENRQKAREHRELNRKKNALESSSSLPAKLIDCDKAGTEEAELYIAEGNSALGSLKAARISDLQALIPIRGKVINVLKETPTRVFANQEVKDIIQTLSAGVGEDFDIEKARYGRIFLASDEDSDGHSINCLLLALFWKMFRPLIESNRLYKVETPLFVIKTKEGKKSRHIYTQNERDMEKEVAQLDRKKTSYTVSRIKGLGECPDDILFETAMNPETRVITQITFDDVKKAERMLELALGKDVSQRKDWLASLEISDADLAD